MSWVRRHGIWIAVWLLATAVGGVVLGRLELARLQDAFDTDMRIVHRLLSQRVVQHDAVLATLALLQPPAQALPPEQKLPALYPQILSVQRREGDAAWPTEQQRAAETLSTALRRAVLSEVDFSRGRYEMVLASRPASFALQMDLRAVVPWSEWPMAPQTSPVRVTLEQASQTFVVQRGAVDTGRGSWRFAFSKHLAADSQPFDVVGLRTVGWAELPWSRVVLCALAVAAVLAGLRAWQLQRQQRRRAEELLRLGQVGRLNALGELAAGMAHELNQPLTALLASTQAASRLLDEEPPELPLARSGMRQAVEQARRAADVVGRLRRVVERPELAAQPQPVALEEAVRNAFYLLEPQFQRAEVAPQLQLAAHPVVVQADPVALDQLIHNLLMNALQALERVPPHERHLKVVLASEKARGLLEVVDTGPGIAAEVMARIFEPFFTTREGGLGLGLSLCETLATGMGGHLTAHDNPPRGAAFTLSLPLLPA
ncbi:MAG: two-component sensor histidine kinase [Comamonadaceae bacterium]|nr:MAG: two-component sensor histidine kinase [Comamonadaceae bacterium]